jgi:DHA3 family tetracycline resistance protein-like MFS transporter
VPLVATAFVSIPLGVFVIFAMREHAFARAATPVGWRDMASTVRASGTLVRGRPLLVALFASSALVGAASEGFDRLSEIQLFTVLATLPFGAVFWFGLVRVVGMLVGIAAAQVTRSRADGDDRSIAKLLTIVESLRLASIVAFALATGFPLVVSTRWAKMAFEAASRPIHQAWLVRKIDPEVRATVLSMHSMCNAAGQIAGGPVIGLVAVSISVPIALVASAGFLLPNVAIYARQASLAARRLVQVEVPT